MKGFWKFINVFDRILATLLAAFAFLSALVPSAVVVLGNKYYVYPQGISLTAITVWAIAAIVLFILLILIVIYYWRTLFRGFWRELLSAILVIAYVFALFYAGWMSTAVYIILGPQGHSYTEDIANYGVYDFEYSPKHFPESIDDDMEVIKYSYFHKYSDASQTDIYLEVKFDSEEDFNYHLNKAIETFGEDGVNTFENPYDPSYTDVINSKWSAGIQMVQSSDAYSYVDMFYYSISYSKDELIIIYNHTRVGSDLEVSYYYPAYLRRFNVEFDPENDFEYTADKTE